MEIPRNEPDSLPKKKKGIPGRRKKQCLVCKARVFGPRNSQEAERAIGETIATAASPNHS